MATYITTDLRAATLPDYLPHCAHVAFADGTTAPAYRLTAPLLVHLWTVADDLDAQHASGALSAEKIAVAAERYNRITLAASAEIDPEAIRAAARLTSDDPERFAAMLAEAVPGASGASEGEAEQGQTGTASETDGEQQATVGRDPFHDPTVPTIDHADLLARDAALVAIQTYNAAIDARPIVLAERREAKKKRPKVATEELPL